MLCLPNKRKLLFRGTVGADQSRIMQEQMSGAAMAMPADTNKAFKVQCRSQYAQHWAKTQY